MAAVAANFGRDVSRSIAKIERVLADARRVGADLVVFPDATLGGGREPDGPAPRGSEGAPLPLAFGAEAPELSQVTALAGDLVVCFGYTELDGSGAGARRYSAALCVSGDGVLGRHRKVHLPADEATTFEPGTSFEAFDTPVGRLGMVIDYDKTFPESARALALGGAEIVASLSARPAGGRGSGRFPEDSQPRLFDVYDSARAAENQIVWVSSVQTSAKSGLRLLRPAKVVGPDGAVLARTRATGGLAVAEIDVAAEVARARRGMHHLAGLVPSSYGEPPLRPVHRPGRAPGRGRNAS